MPYSFRSRRRMVRKRLGPGGRKAFRSRRNVRRAEGGGSAPALLSWQSFRPSGAEGLTIHRRNPCPLCRPAPAGSRGGGGNGPVAGRLAGSGRAWRTRVALALPDRQREGQARVGECHPPFAAARVRAANKRHATACRTWTPSGDHRVCARIAPPRACASHAHPYQPSSEASARARPSGPCFSPKPRRYPARDRRTLSIRKPYLTQLVRAANRTRSIASPAPWPVDFSPVVGGDCSVEEVLT